MARIAQGEWSVEPTFQATRAYRGRETTRWWTQRTVWRGAPLLMVTARGNFSEMPGPASVTAICRGLLPSVAAFCPDVARTDVGVLLPFPPSADRRCQTRTISSWPT